MYDDTSSSIESNEIIELLFPIFQILYSVLMVRVNSKFHRVIYHENNNTMRLKAVTYQYQGNEYMHNICHLVTAHNAEVLIL